MNEQLDAGLLALIADLEADLDTDDLDFDADEVLADNN